MIKSMKSGKVLLIAFYNKKALGVRYLESVLLKNGHSVRVVYYKDFNSLHPSKTSDKELALLNREIERFKPDLIGLSIMSSMYLETVDAVINLLLNNKIPIVCGGAFATLYPDYFLDKGVNFVIRSDGENAMVSLISSLINAEQFQDIPSLCYVNSNGNHIINKIGLIENNLDNYGIPVVKSKNSCFIENNSITEGDPQAGTLSYELIASRGCPFNCSYCCCNNLRKILPKGVQGVRTRSVDSVIEELVEAKKQYNHIGFIHFYDEIFPTSPEWVDNFVEKYKKYIQLPFTIWSHPKAIQLQSLQKLVRAGLVEVIMGIQSGSEHILHDVFNRNETQSDILYAVEAIHNSGVFWCTYDFMLQHPFESIEDLKETYYLVKQFAEPFELQLHGLNFLPGSDIVQMALNQGIYSQDELNSIMFGSMEEQYSLYWKRNTSLESDLWYKLIYCLQFKSLKKKAASFEENIVNHEEQINLLYKQGQKYSHFRYLYKKSRIVLKRFSLSQ